MKEATGELNMTVVTVVAIAAVAAFFYAFVWPGIKNNIKASTYCATAVCYDNDVKNCHYKDDKNQDQIVDCTSYYKKAAEEPQQ